MSNTYCHIEIPSTDLKRSADFYGEVFGWKTTFMPEPTTYAVYEVEGGIGGGFDSTSKVADDGGVVCYVQVDDIPAALGKVLKAGGQQVKEKTAIGNEWGYYGLFKDCCGNLMGLWSKT